MSEHRVINVMGEALDELLERNGLVAIRIDYLSALESIKEKYEIAASSLEILAGHIDPEIRVFVESSIGRMESPDRATPFEDLRYQAENARRALEEARAVLGRVVEAAGASQLGGAPLLAAAIREAKRCLVMEV